MGSKARISKDILPLILKDRKSNQYYIEPFIGGANTISKVDGKRIGSDINPYLIILLKSIQEGYLFPSNISEEEYKFYKSERDNGKITPMIAFVGFCSTYGGRFYEGYARGGFYKDGQPRNYAKERLNNIMKTKEGLQDILLYNCKYSELEIPNNSIIYCDPPYQGTKSYKTEKFNNELFFDWCYEMNDKGHQIFLSEYSAPKDFVCIWEKEVVSSLRTNNNKKAVEKLYKL